MKASLLLAVAAQLLVTNAMFDGLEPLRDAPARGPHHTTEAHFNRVQRGKTRAQLIEEAESGLHIDIFNKYNFVVIGEPASGKTELVNALRGLPQVGPNVAVAGQAEQVGRPLPYYHPHFPHVVIWEAPAPTDGVGYFHANTLYAFDGILLVTSGTFDEAVFKIALDAHQWRVPVFFVRTGFSAAIPVGTEPSAALAEIRANVTAQIQGRGHPLTTRHAFVISTQAFLDPAVPPADEPRLLAAMGHRAQEDRSGKPRLPEEPCPGLFSLEAGAGARHA
eukprot:m.245651 g.245651  ORF g.245651 m.245651 type:complete len:278 (+) comp14753_c0_seq1:25-858(+)